MWKLQFTAEHTVYACFCYFLTPIPACHFCSLFVTYPTMEFARDSLRHQKQTWFMDWLCRNFWRNQRSIILCLGSCNSPMLLIAPPPLASSTPFTGEMTEPQSLCAPGKTLILSSYTRVTASLPQSTWETTGTSPILSFIQIATRQNCIS